MLTPLPHLSVTADLFRIDIDNRIALSNALSGAAVNTVLAAQGITNVQQVAFFTNALDTRTEGFDIAANYRGDLGPQADYLLSFGFENSPTKVRRVAGNPAVPALPLLSAHPILLLADAQPANKLTGSGTLNWARVSATLEVIRYGHYTDAPISAAQTFSSKTVANLSGSYRFTPAVSVTVGVLNIGDVYPDRVNQLALAYASFGNAFVYGEESPIGTDGRAYFVRLTYKH